MITLDKCKRLLDSGFSLITASGNKKPNMKTWKQYQTTPIDKHEFEKAYTSQTTNSPTEIVGIITGFNGLEVIDVDLKVFPTLQEQDAFWKELYDYLKDNIDDFDMKFVIYKTQNQGYHILYRCELPEGNKKIAALQGHTEAVIESRGKGGYVVIYENKISKRDYLNISKISDRDREILWSICKTFNYVGDEQQIEPDARTRQEFNGVVNRKTVWQDYNDRHTIWDVISDEFKIVRKLSKWTIILREGAKSSQSGYIYSDSGCMYLFSTGTRYPNEKLISPFIAFAYKYHKGNVSEAARELYKNGYGDRMVKPLEADKIETIIPTQDLIFPIDIFPAPFQTYMLECNRTLDASIDYMGCSMLWLLSLSIGNSINVEIKPGWVESCNIWIAVVGKAGIGKSPSIDHIIAPLKRINSREVQEYIKAYEKWQAYEKLKEDDKKQVEEATKPHKTQFIVDDITLEALVDLHSQAKNGVGVFKDELNGWFKDMNKYREGSDLEFWLSTWSGKSITVNRITRSGSYIHSPLIPVLGGIQPSVLTSIYTEENKDNGFVDRMLLSYPDLQVEYFNRNIIDREAWQWYNDAVVAFFQHVKRNYIVIDADSNIVPYRALFSDEAMDEIERIFNNITDTQRSDEENEYMKSMLPKQKSYIPRFALIIHAIDCYISSKPIHEVLHIGKESVLKAEKLSKYFIAMAKKIKVNNIEVLNMKKIMNLNKSLSNKEKFYEMYKINPDLNRTEAGEILGLSRRQIQSYIKEITEKGVK